jgi:hypothetical protein
MSRKPIGKSDSVTFDLSGTLDATRAIRRGLLRWLHRLALKPPSFTATQSLPEEHEIATPAPYPPGNTVEGLDHRPDIQVATAPLRPMTEHSVAEPHETEYAPALLNAGTSVSRDHFWLWNVIASPLMVTAIQN